MTINLIIILLLGGVLLVVSLLHVLPADTSGLATSEGRADREVDVLLGVQSDDERRDVHDLLADTAEETRIRITLVNSNAHPRGLLRLLLFCFFINVSHL